LADAVHSPETDAAAGAHRSGYVGSDIGFARRPAEQRLEMPAQPLVTRRSRPAPESDGQLRFLLIFGASVITTLIAAHAMMNGFFTGGVNALEWIAVTLFAVNFCYLGIAAYTGVAGTIVLLLSPKAPPPSKDLPNRNSRTAIVIALYQ